MKKLVLLSTVFLLLGAAFTGCKSEEDAAQNRKVEIDPRYNKYVSAFTGGVVSANSKITIKLRTPIDQDLVNAEKINGLISFSPELEGETHINNANTISFIPGELMQSGTLYKASLNLGKLANVPPDMQFFDFNFTTLQQRVRFKFAAFNTPKIAAPESIEVKAELSLNDVLPKKFDLEDFVLASQEGENRKIQIKKISGQKLRLTVQNVRRKAQSSQLTIRWKGSKIGADDREEVVSIPAVGDFTIAKVQVQNGEEQHIKIHFSDCLDPMQDINGLLALNSVETRLEIKGHAIIIYPVDRITGKYDVQLYRGIENYAGDYYSGKSSFSIEFQNIAPNIKLMDSGNIIPGDSIVNFPVKAVNLEAVDILVTKIYEDNLTQFFQVNDLDGSYQLNRVGKEVLRKKVWLDPQGQKNLHEWNTFEIPLSDLMSFDRGTLYHLEIRFKQEHSVYPCSDADGVANNNLSSELEIEYGKPWSEGNWRRSRYYYDDYWQGDYNYGENDNPCKSSYYRYKSEETNILSSNVGMIAKAGEDKKLNLFINNLQTTDPIVGASIKIYDYQQQLLGTTTTDGEGMAQIHSNKKPFLVIAEAQGEKAFLRLYDRSANSLSKFFDVAGAPVQQGVKGYVYTERGAWRPGDSIYVSFMLEDLKDRIPANHPVVFEMENPKGQKVQEKVAYEGVNGLYDFRTATAKDALTGNYKATVSVGAREFTKYLKVETIKPNRLKVELTHSGDEDVFHSNDRFTLKSRWLHGAEAGGLKARVKATLSRTATTFSGWKKYNFDDEAKDFKSESNTVFEGKLNSSGEVSFDPNIHIGKSASGHVRTTFGVKVFEKSGSFSVDESTFTYAPFKTYAGAKFPELDLYGYAYRTGKEHSIDVVKVNEAGKAVNGAVDVRMYKLEWRWWWDSYDDDLASYIHRSSTVTHKSEHVELNNGEGTFSFNISAANEGRYYIRFRDPESGHTSGKVIYVDQPHWSTKNRKDKEGQSMLTLATNKEKYNAGEIAQVTFPSPEEGQALLTIENGTEVLDKKWVPLSEGETTTTFTTDEAMTPNVYVHVMLLQPHAKTANDLPIRMYGVVPITVENPGAHLQPEIKTPEVWRPEQKTQVKVSEKNNKKMTYTLAVVDEGLLDLTNFKTPSPYDYFNAHQALGVKTWDMYDDVMDALHKNNKLLAVGGGASGKKPKSEKANRFEPMVRFLGPFEMKGGTKTHNIDVPNYVGSVRIMVVAGEDGRYGSAEKTSFVRNPLMVLGTLPRVLAPGDELKIPANVFAMEKKVKNVDVSIETNDLIDLTEGGSQKLRFDGTGDKMAYFPAKIKNKSGIATVKITAKSAGETATDEIEIDVRQPIGRIFKSQEFFVAQDSQMNQTVQPYGIQGTYKAHIELSALPPLNLSKKLDYLLEYPHGCVEQIISKAFPQLYLSSLVDMSESEKERAQKNVSMALDKLLKYQTNEGGFSYWPGNPYANEWGTDYATHFIIEAQNKGYTIPSGMKSSALYFLRQKARSWSRMNKNRKHRYNELEQAYRLYVLAKSGNPEWGAMNRLKEENDISIPTKWRLAGAYALSGKSGVAEDMIYDLETDIPEYRQMAHTYGSDIRDEAMILEVLIDMQQKNKGAYMARRLSKAISNRSWMSTQTTAYSLIALSKFYKKMHSSQTQRVKYRIGSGSYKNISLAKGVKRIPLNGATSYAVKTDDESVFVQQVRSGIPPFGEEPEAHSNMKIRVRYQKPSGQSINVASIEQGEEFTALVQVFNPGAKGDFENMVLEQIFPSGWEIINERMNASAQNENQNSYFDYRDIRDDRVYTYFDLDKGETKMFEVRLIASFSGAYKFPATRVSAMYDATISANTAGKMVRVYQPGSRVN